MKEELSRHIAAELSKPVSQFTPPWLLWGCPPWPDRFRGKPIPDGMFQECLDRFPYPPPRTPPKAQAPKKPRSWRLDGVHIGWYVLGTLVAVWGMA